MAMIMMDGQAVPSPCVIHLALADVKSPARRNALGEEVIDRVAVKRHIELGWARLTDAELELVFRLAGGTAVFFTVSYPENGQQRTITAHAASRSARMLSCENGVPLWTDISLSLRER